MKYELENALRTNDPQKVKKEITSRNLNDYIQGLYATPLQYTLLYDFPESAKYLIEEGADVNKSQDGLMFRPTLCLAIQNHRNDIAQLLIDKGFNLHKKYRRRDTPLHWAAEYNNHEIIPLLLRYHININSRNDDGETPLHYAMKENSIECVEVLLKNNADTSIKRRDRKTPLNLAKEIDNSNCIEAYQMNKKSSKNFFTRLFT